MFYWTHRIIINFLFRCFFKVEMIGLEHVPKKGRLILCSNHQSNFDPIFYMVFFPRQPIFMGKDTAFKIPFIGFFLRSMGAFPVVRGTSDSTALSTATNVLNDNKVLGMFPEGKRVAKGEKVSAKKGVGALALSTNSPIVPAVLISDFKLFSKIVCKIGAPIYVDKQYNRMTEKEIHDNLSNLVLNEIYSLKDA